MDFLCQHVRRIYKNKTRNRYMYILCILPVMLSILYVLGSIFTFSVVYNAVRPVTFERSYFPPQCSEGQNIVFLKIHKTGSSTIANMLQRFGFFRNLNFALPKKSPGQIRYNYFGNVGETLQQNGILSSNGNSSQFNILYNHVIFNKDEFENLFPNNGTVYVTMIREYVSQFLSSLLYFLHENIYNAAKENITAYLESPQVFEPESPYLSFTDNRQALDLGLPANKVRDKQFIKKYIETIDTTFHLVMIMEYFDESLILLRRLLCWSLKDILYMRKNTAYKSHDFRLSAYDKSLLKQWNLADHMIYDYFYVKFNELLKKDPTVMEEAHHFKAVLEKTQSFCNGSRIDSHINIESSQWNPLFKVSSLDCAYMGLSELRFLNKLLQMASIPFKSASHL